MAIKKVYLTSEGARVSAYCQNNNIKVNFLSVGFGSGENYNPSQATKMTDEKISTPIQSCNRIESNHYKIRTEFSNDILESDLIFREICLYCEDPEKKGEKVMYCYGNAKTDEYDYTETIPAFTTSGNVSTRIFDIDTYVQGDNATYYVEHTGKADIVTVQEIRDDLEQEITDRTEQGNTLLAKINKEITDRKNAVIDITHGGTGETSLERSCNALINGLSLGGDNPQDTDYFISQYVGGGQTTYHRRPISALWGYIKSKIASVLGLTATSYGGKASTAGTADTAKACSGNSATATKATQDENGNNIATSLSTKKHHQLITISSSNVWVSFAMNMNAKNQVINITDQYGGVVELYGAATGKNEEKYKKIKAIRKSYGDWSSQSIATNSDYKIKTIKFDKSTNKVFIYVCAWTNLCIEGTSNVASIVDSVPDTAIDIPLEFAIAQYDKKGNDIADTYATKTEVDGVSIKAGSTDKYISLVYNDGTDDSVNQGILIQYNRTNFMPSTFLFLASGYKTNMNAERCLYELGQTYSATAVYSPRFYLDKDNNTLYIKIVNYSKVSFRDLLHARKNIVINEVSEIPQSAVLLNCNRYSNEKHTHDDRYYTETEIDTKLSKKATQAVTTMVDLGFTKDSYNSVRSFWSKLVDKVGLNGVVTFTWASAKQAYIGDSTNNVLIENGTLVFTATSKPQSWACFTGTLTKSNGCVYAISCTIDGNTSEGDETWNIKSITSYTHPATSGNKHIPSGGTSNQVLGYSADGTAQWTGRHDFIYTCSTASATQAKTVELSGFTLYTGASIRVVFTNGNSKALPTLNVNGTGAKTIAVQRMGGSIVQLSTEYGGRNQGAYMWASNTVLDLYYNGAYWLAINNPIVACSISSDYMQYKGSAWNGGDYIYEGCSYKIYLDGYKEQWGIVQKGSDLAKDSHWNFATRMYTLFSDKHSAHVSICATCSNEHNNAGAELSYYLYTGSTSQLLAFQWYNRNSGTINQKPALAWNAKGY